MGNEKCEWNRQTPNRCPQPATAAVSYKGFNYRYCAQHSKELDKTAVDPKAIKRSEY